MTRKQFAVIATRIKEEIDNIKSLSRELSKKGLTGSKKKIKSALPPGDTFIPVNPDEQVYLGAGVLPAQADMQVQLSYEQHKTLCIMSIV